MSPPSAAMERCQRQQSGERINHRTWGDELGKHSKNTIRVLFQNINGFGWKKDDESKTRGFYDLMAETETDIFAMAETNVDWRKLPKKKTIWETTKSWFENVTTVASTNQHDKHDTPYQPGGTAVITQGDMALRVMGRSFDTDRMGRWCSVLYRGKENIKLRVISVYYARKPNDFGHRKAYIQQKNAMLKLKIKGDPCSKFWDDFWKQLDEWLEDGEQLIIGGDWNKDVRDENFLKEFEERNLYPATMGRHDPATAPETYSGGKDPIDEIFVSSTLHIKASGFLEHSSSEGDHRPVWVDISKESALGDNFPDLPLYQARRLKCSDPRVVKKYLKHLHEFYERKGVYGKCIKLFNNFSKPLSTEESELFEEIDNLRYQGMLQAEKKCRKLKMGQNKWSPKYALARKKIKYIKASLSKLRGRAVNTQHLFRLGKQLRFSTAGKSEEELIKMIVTAKAEYEDIKVNHDDHRKTFLEDLASALEAAGKGSQASNLKQLQLREQQRTLFRRLKRLKGEDNLSTSFVTTRNEDGTSTDIIEKEAIENAIIPTNQKKFHQSEDSCPFLKHPLVDQFGFHGEKEGYKAFLEGTYEAPEDIDEITKSFINICQEQPAESIHSLSRTPLDFKESWIKMKEKTSSRRLHFGHFKACCKDDALTAINYVLAEVPFQSGYSPTRWKNATDVMILKKAGLYDVDKLRTIVLYEADFNHNNKWLGKAMMDKACEFRKIATEQYSIPGKKAIDHALNRRLIFDITRYQKSSLAMTSCDLKSCYDRIVHVPAMMAMHRAGASVEASSSMFATIQSAQHVTRTAFGDSTSTYGGIEHFNAPVMGVGQGNGCGPQVWAVVSSVMFEILKRKGLTTSFQAPISKEDLKLCGFAFVDDTDLLQACGTQKHHNNPEFTMQKMQESIDTWEAAAKTTGGSIAVDKSWFYLIHFEWKNGQWKYGDLDNILADELNCKDKNGRRQHLNYISADQAKEMLGVFLAPDGNNEKQIQEMKKKTKYLGELIRSGHVDRNETWTSLTMVAMKSLEYPLPALTLSENDCIQIMWPLLKSYLPRAGINRHYPRDVLYGQVDKHGIGLKNLFLTQGISHVVDIINHLWHKSLTGTLIRQSLEYLRIELGMNGNIFDLNYNKVKHCILTESWIEHTWKFVAEYGINIAPKIKEIELRRVGDSCIMEKVVRANILEPNELKWFNRCRLFLKVATLADITTADGKFLRKDCLEGVQSKSHRDLGWPNWERPPTYAWTIWRKSLRLVYTNGFSGRLSHQLGPWKEFNTAEWEWMISRDRCKLYKSEGNTWKQFNLARSRTRSLRFSQSYHLVQRPDVKTLLPTGVRKAGKALVAEDPADIVHTGKTEETLMEKLDPGKFRWLFSGMKRSDNIDKIIEDLKNNNIQAVSDGSFGLEGSIVTTAAWILKSQDGSQFLSGICTPPYNEGCKGAYRAELSGLLAIVHMTTYLSEKHGIQAGKVHIGCDNQKALTTSFQWVAAKRNTNQKHSDILSAISGLLKLNKISITYEHIPAHQDEILAQDQLTPLAQMNVQMDLMAKVAAKLVMEGQLSPPRAIDHPFGFMAINVHDRPINHLTASKLNEFISDISIHEWWLTKNRYQVRDIPNIHWGICSVAAQNETKSSQRFASKWVSGQLASGKKMKQWKFRPHDECPFCMQAQEDTQHILLCQHHDAIAIWNKQFLLIQESLTKWETEATLQVALCQDLQSWRHNHHLSPLRFLPQGLQRPIADMRQLGYDRVLEGLLPKSVIEYQDSYYNELDTRKTGTTWGKKVYKLFWKVLKELWMGRNEQLHQTNRLQDLQGLPVLKEAIRREYQLGLHRLPACEFSIFFSSSVDKLLERDISALRIWLQSIRLGRELHGGSHLIQDEYSTNGAFRSWLGLPTI